MNLVWKEGTVDRCNFQYAPIITATNILQKRMSTFLVKGQQGWLIDFKRGSDSIDERFGFNSEFTDFIDDDHFTIVDCMLNRWNSYTFELCSIEAIAENA